MDVTKLRAWWAHKQGVMVDKSQQSASQLADLPSHAVLDRGRLIGLWEYDVATQSVAWTSFVPKDRLLREVVAACENYVRHELGDARSFSLDSPKSRVARIAAMRMS